MDQTKDELNYEDIKVTEAGDAKFEQYNFTPTVINVDGKEILDYSGVDHTKIFLANKMDILDIEKPSWIPDIDLSMRHLPIAVKSHQDGCYYVMGNSGSIIRMSADVLTAAVDYNLKYLRAKNKRDGKRKTVSLPKRQKDGVRGMERLRYQKLVSLLQYVPDYMGDIGIHKYPLRTYEQRVRQNQLVFGELSDLISKLKDKTLDMNQAKLDYINSYAKGEDTSYGDNGLDDSLEQKYGINIKKQNGTTFTSQQQSRIENAVASAYEYFGDLSGLARDYKLKVSYADDCNQHARKAIGVFTNYYNAIGVSFFTDSFEENRTMVHELAHWLDYTKGKEYNYRMASDKDGTIENAIAEKYKELVKKNTKKKLGDYWFRTCECFARAIEQDFEINCCQDLDRCKPPAYLEKGVFIREIQPLIDELMKENEQKFGLSARQRPYNQPDPAHQALSQKFNEKQVHPLCFKFIDQLKVQNPDEQQLLSQCSQIYNEIFSSGEPKELSQFRTKCQEKLRFFHGSKEESQALDKFDSYVKELTNESLQKLEVENRFFSNPSSGLEDNYREYLFQLAVITALICCQSYEELKNRVLMSHLENMPLYTFSLDYNKKKSELIKVELENRKLMPLMEKNDTQQGVDIKESSLNTEQSSQVFVDKPALQDFLQRFNDGKVHPLFKEFLSLKDSALNFEEWYSNSCEIYNKIFAGGEPEQIIHYRKRYEKAIRNFDESPVQKDLLDDFAKELSDLDVPQIHHIIFDQQELVDGLISKQQELDFQSIVVRNLAQWPILDESDLSLIADTPLPFVCNSMQFAAKKLELCKKEIESRELNKKLDELEVQPMSSSVAKELREKCRKILAEKSDNEITEQDKKILQLYTGAGGLHEKGSSSAGVLYEFYTPQEVVDSMWRLADAYAPQATTVLEPAAGIGGFALVRPTTQKFTMYEVDQTAARINKILHPEATVINESFQRQFFDAGERVINKKYVQPKFDLVIGNPPYGDYKDKWRGLGEGVDFQRYEEYFLSRGIDALKDDSSAMVMIVPSGFINSSLDKAKSIIAGKGQLVDAWRLPEGIFSTTKIGTDILVFKKGSCDPQQISDGKWFKDNPQKILGEVRQRVNRFGREEDYVYFNFNQNDQTSVDLLKKIVPDVKSIDNSPKISTNTIEETLQEVDVKEATNATDSSGIHQGDSRREADLRGKRVAGYANSDRATLPDESEGNRATTDGSRGHDVDSPSRGSVQQSLSEHDGPAFEGNDSPTSRSIGNVNSEQSGVGTHGKKLRGSAEQLPDRLTLSAREFSEFYTGANFSQEEYPILLATDWKGRVDLQSLNESQKQWLSTSDKYIEINKDYFVNRSLFCSGNIYDKLNKLEETRHELSSEIYYHKQKEALLSVLPEKKTLDQVEISLLGDIAKSFMVTRAITRNEIQYVNDVEEFVKTTSEEQMNLVEDFISWATGYLLQDSSNGRHYISNWVEANISREDLPDGIRWNDIVEYIDMKSVKADRSYTSEGKAIAKAEAESKRENRKITAEMLFNRYLRENLPATDKDRLINEWNRRFNGYVAPDYSKMPVLVDGMTTVKDGKPFKLYDQQVRGVAFLTQKGNGLLAYDVGVGKTATGIVATVSQIQSKRSKRPLIVVPNSVYTKWIDDFTQIFPNVPLIELGNLSPKAIKQYDDGNHGLLIPEGSVSICTNEALMRMTFEDSSIKNELFDDFAYLLGKSDEVHSENDKERAKACEAIAEKIGKTAKTKDGYIFFERCGFDHVTVDEAHRFKNLFRTPRSSKPDSKGQSQEFSGIGSGEPSNRALKLFAITQMIQRKNNDRNVFMLTATPFTNSPLEIYSMLSYIGRQQLVESNIYDIRDFLNEFANVINEWSVDATGTIKPKSVMKSFRNPHALQALIMQYIDKVDGEEAGIIRPDKEQHQIQFEMTEIQQKIVDHEIERMTSVESKNNGGVLVAMNNMRMAMVSPALLDSNIYPEIEDFPTDVVESSPKLTYVCDTVAQVWKEKKECGQVIYMPYGVDQIDAVKTALVSRGIPEDSIGIMRPGDNMSEEKTDKLRDQFNDKNHPLKVLIGSKKIAEGIDLNGNSIALYNTMLDWNPTERIQVEGRIWRQGNRQERVHIVYPLMQDSIESLIFQKYDEKSNRINDIFSYKGDDALDVSSINPEELKFDLIRDPWKRADFIIEKMIVEVEKDKSVIEKRIKDLGEIKFKKNSLQEQILANEQSILKYQQALDYPEQREPWWTEASLKNWIKITRHEISLSKSQFDTVLRRMEKMGFANDQMLEDYHQSLVDKLKELNKKIDEIEKSKEQIIEQELNKVAVSRAMDSSFEDKVNNMAQYIIEHTREKVDNKISEKSTLSVEKTPSIESNSDILASSQKDKSLDGHVPSETTTQDDEKGIKDNLEKYQNATLVQNELDLFGDVELPSPSQTDKAEEALADEIWNAVTSDFESKYKDFFNSFLQLKDKFIENPSSKEIEDEFQPSHHKMLNIQVEEIKKMVAMSPSEQVAKLLAIRYINFNGDDGLGQGNLFDYLGISKNISPKGLHQFISKLYLNSRSPKEYKWVQYEDGSGHIESPDKEISFIYDSTKKAFKTYEKSPVWVPVRDEDVFEMANEFVLGEYPDQYISFVEEKRLREQTKEDKTLEFNYFVRDTSEFEAFESFEPVVGLSAVEAVKLYLKMHDEGKSPGIGINIPGDLVFNDPNGLGVTILVKYDGVHDFGLYGDSFIESISSYNDRAKTLFKAYRGLLSELESSGVEVRQPQFLFDKEKQVMSTSEAVLDNQKIEQKFWNLADMLGQENHYIKLDVIKPNLNQIAEEIKSGNSEIIQMVSDFDSVKENHVKNDQNTFGYDILHKLFQNCNDIIQKNIKASFERDKIPYVFLHWSESAVFPFENSCYAIKDFDRIIADEDRYRNNEKERLRQKYGSSDKYYSIPRKDLPPEDRNASFGYDKTKFSIYNLPTLDKRDTISYGPDRYDIGDGYGGLFNYIRRSCSHQEVVKAMDNLEQEIYFSSLSGNDRNEMRSIIANERSTLVNILHGKLNTFGNLWATKQEKAEALQGIKDAVYESLENILGKAKSSGISGDYAINETQKFLDNIIYGVMRLEDNIKQSREIWEQFPDTCNYKELLKGIYEQQPNPRQVSQDYNLPKFYIIKENHSRYDDQGKDYFLFSSLEKAEQYAQAWKEDIENEWENWSRKNTYYNPEEGEYIPEDVERPEKPENTSYEVEAVDFDDDRIKHLIAAGSCLEEDKKYFEKISQMLGQPSVQDNEKSPRNTDAVDQAFVDKIRGYLGPVELETLPLTDQMKQDEVQNLYAVNSNGQRYGFIYTKLSTPSNIRIFFQDINSDAVELDDFPSSVNKINLAREYIARGIGKGMYADIIIPPKEAWTRDDQKYNEVVAIGKTVSSPQTSWWGKVENKTTLFSGVYLVSTARHGGLMVHESVADLILSKEAQQVASYEKGFYQFEEDAAICVPLYELYQKGLYEGADNLSKEKKDELFVANQESILLYELEYAKKAFPVLNQQKTLDEEQREKENIELLTRFMGNPSLVTLINNHIPTDDVAIVFNYETTLSDLKEMFTLDSEVEQRVFEDKDDNVRLEYKVHQGQIVDRTLVATKDGKNYHLNFDFNFKNVKSKDELILDLIKKHFASINNGLDFTMKGWAVQWLENHTDGLDSYRINNNHDYFLSGKAIELRAERGKDLMKSFIIENWDKNLDKDELISKAFDDVFDQHSVITFNPKLKEYSFKYRENIDVYTSAEQEKMEEANKYLMDQVREWGQLFYDDYKINHPQVQQLDSNADFVLNKASSGMLAKYIDRSEISEIDQFREYAAQRVSGDAQDKSYFDQMWNLGKEFCRQMGWPEAPLPLEMEGKPLVDIPDMPSFDLNQVEIPSMPMGDVVGNASVAELPDKISLSLENLYVYQEHKMMELSLVDELSIAYGTIRKTVDGENSYYDLYSRGGNLLCCDGEVVEVLKYENGIYYLDNENNDALETNNFIKLTDEEFNVATKTISLKELNNMTQIKNMPLFEPKDTKRIPFEIVNNEERGRVNIRFNPKTRIPPEDFNSIIEKLKTNGWRYSRSNKQWYPFGSAVAGGLDFAESLQKEFTRTVYTFDTGEPERIVGERHYPSENRFRRQQPSVTHNVSERIERSTAMAEPKIIYFDRYGRDVEEFQAYFNSHLDQLKLCEPIGEEQAITILNSLDCQRAVMPQDKTNRLGLDERNNLILVHQNEGRKSYKRMELPDLIMYGLETMGNSLAGIEENLKKLDSKSSLSVLDETFKRSWQVLQQKNEATLAKLNEICDIYLLGRGELSQSQQQTKELSVGDDFLGHKIVSLLPIGKGIQEVHVEKASSQEKGSFFVLEEETKKKLNPQLHKYLNPYNGNYTLNTNSRLANHLMKDVLDKKLCPPRDKEYYEKLVKHSIAWPLEYEVLYPVDRTNFKERFQQMIDIHGETPKDLLPFSAKLMNYVKPEEKKDLSDWLMEQGFHNDNAMSKILSKWAEEKVVDKTKRNGYPPRGES